MNESSIHLDLSESPFIPSFLRRDDSAIEGERNGGTFVPSFLRDDRSLEWTDIPSTGTEGAYPARRHIPLPVPVQDEPLGLVLSGGGAKGAYQAGVWKALVESGLSKRIAAISGTSVGALNAAAFATLPDPDDIGRFWHDHVEEIVSPNFMAFGSEKILEAVLVGIAGAGFPFHGFLNRNVLDERMRRILPERWPDSAPSVYASSLECRASIFGELDRSSYRLVRFWVNGEADPQRRMLKILASCAIPWCYSPVEIAGRRFVDGGWDKMGGDNLPIRPILRRHPAIRTIIVVRCNSADIEPMALPSIPGIQFVEIRPAKPLPGIFDDLIECIPPEFVTNTVRAWSGTFAFDTGHADRMYAQGLEDGRKALPESLSLQPKRQPKGESLA